MKDSDNPAADLDAMARRVADQVDMSVPDDGEPTHCLPEIAKQHREEIYRMSAAEIEVALKNPPPELQDQLANVLFEMVAELKLGLPAGASRMVNTLWTAGKGLRKKLLRNTAKDRAEVIESVMSSLITDYCIYSQMYKMRIQLVEDQYLTSKTLRYHLDGKRECDEMLLRILDAYRRIHSLPGVDIHIASAAGSGISIGGVQAVGPTQLKIDELKKSESDSTKSSDEAESPPEGE